MTIIITALHCIVAFWMAVESYLKPYWKVWGVALRMLPFGRLYDWTHERYEFLSDHWQWAAEELYWCWQV